MSIMAKTPSGYKKIGSAYLGERPVDKVFNANGDVVYTLQRELTGVPPLLFKGKEQSELLNYRIYGDTETKQRDYSGSSPLTVPVHDGELYNYRIYGNTANGESVGEKTANLFDGYAEIGSFDLQGADINNNDALSMCRTGYINVLPDTTYTISLNGDYVIRHVGYYGGNFTHIGSLSVSVCTFTTPSATNQIRIVFKTASGDRANVDDFTNIPIMLNAGSTALPYEPYGYKVPIAVTNSGTTSNETIYLPEPIKMVGSEAEYVDYYSQKQYFADGTNTAVTIPALPISTGTNTVTVNTTVQPSSVEVSTDENVSVGDLVTSGQHTGEYKVPVTVEGKNLFDGEFLQGYWAGSNGAFVSTNNWICIKNKITCNPNTPYTLSFSVNSRSYGFAWYDVSGNYISSSDMATTLPCKITAVSPNNAYSFGISIAGYPDHTGLISPEDVTDLMVVEGSTALPYEPYHTPVTTSIYLPEPIKMVGDEAEYIDYGEQKQHRVRKNLFDENTITEGAYIDKFTGNIVTGSTASNVSDFISVVPNNTYTLSYAYIKLSSSNRRVIGFYSALKEWVSFIEYSPLVNTGFNINVPNDIYYIKVTTDIKMTNVMLNSGSEPLAYEPYIENVDIDVTLPALPTVTGTNVLSVGTEVQPSRMDIKGRIKSLT